MIFCDHAVQLFGTEQNQCTPHAVFGTVTVKADRQTVGPFRVKAPEAFRKKVFRGHFILQHLRDGADFPQVFFETADNRLLRERHELQQKAAGAPDAAVRLHQHTEPDGGGNLLRFHKIMGQIVRDFSGVNQNLAVVGIAAVQVAQNSECAAAHRGAHVQMPVALSGQIGFGILHIAFDIAAVIRRGKNRAERPVPVKADGQQTVVLLDQRLVHHQRAGECAAERRRSSRRCPVGQPCRLGKIAACQCEGADLPRGRRRPHHIISINGCRNHFAHFCSCRL